MKKEIEIEKHILVPKHALLKEEEKKKILQKYNINENQLPKISHKDPLVTKLGAKVGDIIKIIRKSETAGFSNYFRMVSHD